MHAPPIEALEQRRELRRRQADHTIIDLRPSERAVLKPFGKKTRQNHPKKSVSPDPPASLGTRTPPPRTGRPSSFPVPAPQAPRRPCGSPPASSQPSPGPNPLDRSRARLQRPDDRPYHPNIGAATDPNTCALKIEPKQRHLLRSLTCHNPACRIDQSRHKQRFLRTRRRGTLLTAPSESASFHVCRTTSESVLVRRPSSSSRHTCMSGFHRISRISLREIRLVATFAAAALFSPAGMLAIPSSRAAAFERTISCVSVSSAI